MELNSIKSAQLNGIINQYEIPESVRKDGTIRKARRVKPGFVPQEEVPLYTPKGKRVATTQSAYPPGWHPTAAASAGNKSKADKQPKPQQVNSASNADKIKIKVKKEAAKPAPSKVDTKVEEISEKLQEKLQISEDPTIELSKKLKRIRKKLREVEILDEKIKAGEITEPEKDQLEKISRRKKFEEEINQLEMEREKLRKLKPNKSA